MGKKYELTNETREFQGRVLHRIRALKDFGCVRAGDLGGWVEKEGNLSQRGACWVYENARVFENARVTGNAWVYENARVFENAWVTGNAQVYGSARVYGDALVFENAWVYGNAQVYGSARVYGNALVFENARVHGNAVITGCMHIQKTRDYLTVGPVGSRNDFTTFAKDQNGNVAVSCGCFYGTLDEFSEKVGATHENSKFGVEYRAAIELAKAHFTEEEEQ